MHRSLTEQPNVIKVLYSSLVKKNQCSECSIYRSLTNNQCSKGSMYISLTEQPNAIKFYTAVW